jgi:Leucine-rich repeat (LRR) protein
MFTNLEFADYADNALTGLIPASIFEIPTLRILYLSNNELSGFIPTSYATASNLRDLFLDGNALSGLVPPISPGQLDSLMRLRLEDNELSGSVPASVCALRSDSLTALTSDCAGLPPQIECAADCCTECFA